ncbi:toll/interleukin-1 receptor domain-containing protein [Flagellimonas algicola]|uniref:Toll/interleukin-1 receptor domain-containing protein n=1 Tax=Flagellimonas algicola TaxID=2583815 RepID=A0ABY2WR36_9FLAO|nr:toll/interleukin-1 receptor domain-containing protein [Allomuricauda algicola]TMU57468.1 toll/interleukin-1 receptor domain-containing protein [Allomuricauda algicola]
MTTKRRCGIILILGFSLLFLFLTGISFGSATNHIYWAWLWFIIIYIPLLTVLFRSKQKKISRKDKLLEILSSILVLSTFFVIWAMLQLYDDNNPSTFRKPFIISSFILFPFSWILTFLMKKNETDSSSIENDVEHKNQRVFISYNHKDKTDALKIYARLKLEGIELIMDEFDMEVGEDINEFIKDSISNSGITLSVISKNSLSSSWVGKETKDTLFLLEYTGDRKLIGCYTDNEFLDPEFVKDAVKEIDEKIEKLQNLVDAQRDLKVDSTNLNVEITRLTKLRNNLPDIIGYLKSVLCLDIRGYKFEESMQQIVKSVKEQ